MGVGREEGENMNSVVIPLSFSKVESEILNKMLGDQIKNSHMFIKWDYFRSIRLVFTSRSKLLEYILSTE